ncbi:AAA family ATPase [Acinetobacter rathckeae]|uniref:AAA family ATPase n=1 Tax=Acinetobacter rathckeae TaxID=2605272 RepID=UPI0018A32F91|nr:AAA family ATPase [Acinetobacter rathckeae]MBF7696199.1 ATP-binding protein [Acinetobacter rathckeae]
MSFIQQDLDFYGKKIILSEGKQDSSNEHTYSIIIGKNATGKSRLLANIIDTHLKKKSIYQPSKIIAVTNILYDKFPAEDKNNNKKYFCFNARKFYEQSFENSFYSRILDPRNRINLGCIESTFAYLGYKAEFSLDLYLNLSFSKIKFVHSELEVRDVFSLLSKYSKEIASEKEEFPWIIKFVDYFNNLNIEDYSRIYMIEKYDIDYEDSAINEQFLTKLLKYWKYLSKKEVALLVIIKEYYFFNKDLDEQVLFEVVEFINKHIHEKSKKNQQITIDVNLKTVPSKPTISMLMNLEVLQIREITFEKIDVHEQIKDTSFSSGEKAIFAMFLNIASEIQDDALICIDEPEVSLHPKWQTEFIIKLQEVFSDYKGCHFIIATHSPQIVSGLKSKQGFIVDLEINETYLALDYTHKSADYQLAKIFKTPGYNNEYILKSCFRILSLIKNENPITEADKKYIQELIAFERLLKEDDMSLYLIQSVLALLSKEDSK